MNRILPLLTAIVCILPGLTAQADELRLPRIFGDHMVLQRDAAAPVWGWAERGSTVQIRIAGQTHQATADDDGRWMVQLDPMPAGGPHELVVQSGDERLALTDVLVGEVWLSSGQSNMDWQVSRSANAQEEIAAADHPRIRIFTVRKKVAREPLDDVIGGQWAAVTPGTIGAFSAVAYYFGRDLHQALDVPIGLVNAAWGGTPSEAWTSEPALQSEEAAAAILTRFDEALARYPQAHAEWQERLRAWREAPQERPDFHADPGNSGEAQGYARPDFDDADWATTQLPGLWEDDGLAIDGAVWFRRTLKVPAEMAGQPLTLELGPIDDFDVTYVNGRRVGTTGSPGASAWNIPRAYALPRGLVQAGENTIAVRVFDHYGGGGFAGMPHQMALRAGDGEQLPLAGAWRRRVELELDPAAVTGGNRGRQPPAPMGPEHAHSPAGLFNGMIHPLIPFHFAGAIWYQGETNAGRAEQYRTIFPLMIRDWRAQWNRDDLPFGFVQLANYMAVVDEPTDTPWAHLRDAQLFTLRTVPHTGMAVIIDIGEADDIHPRNKQDVGKRLARWALADVYDQDVVKSGPLFASAERDGSAMVVTFETFGSTLATRGSEPLRGFTLAGEDRVWRHSEAEILSDGRVKVWADDVLYPAAVRYAWANNPESANLVNEEGLPASPFRSDDWPGPTDGKR